MRSLSFLVCRAADNLAKTDIPHKRFWPKGKNLREQVMRSFSFLVRRAAVMFPPRNLASTVKRLGIREFGLDNLADCIGKRFPAVRHIGANI